MPTKTIYTDSFMVVIDIGAAPATEPWLEETTYLIDSSGYTTSMVAQTDRPTAGVALHPVPFTPANQQALKNPSVTKKATVLPSGTTSPGITLAPTATSTNPTPKKSPPTILLAGAAIGAVVGLIIMAFVAYLLRRRSRRRNSRRIQKELRSLEEEKTGSPHSSDSMDTLVDESRTAQPASSTEETPPRLKSLQELEKEYKIFNSMNDRDREALKYGRYDRTRHEDHAKSDSSTTLAASPPTRHSPPFKQTSREAMDPTDRSTAAAQLAQPASILKRPAHEGIGDAALGALDGEHTQAYPPKFMVTRGGRAKKGVRWGESRTSIVERWIGRAASMVSSDGSEA